MRVLCVCVGGLPVVVAVVVVVVVVAAVAVAVAVAVAAAVAVATAVVGQLSLNYRRKFCFIDVISLYRRY